MPRSYAAARSRRRIDVWELKSVLEAMGQRPTEDELFSLISEVDSDFSGTIDFSEFLRIIEKQKEKATAHNDEQDFIDAFVACGGNEDKSGVGEQRAAPRTALLAHRLRTCAKVVLCSAALGARTAPEHASQRCHAGRPCCVGRCAQ